MRVLVAAWIGSTNLGDELVFSALVRKLTERGGTVTAISLDPPATRQAHRVEAVGHTDVAGLWRAVGRADAVVFGGGGLLQDQTSAANLPYHLARLWAARARHRPAALVGVGVGPLATRLGRALVAASVPPWLPVAVRDADSARLLTEVTGREPVVAADLAFALPVPAVPPGDHLAVCLRPLVTSRAPAALGWRAGAGDDAWLDAAAAALDETVSATGLPLRFVALQAERDGVVAERVAERLAAPAELVAPDVGSVVTELAGARAVASMRYHGGVGALLGGRPVTLLSYSPKVRALGEQAAPAATVLGVDAAGWRGLPAAVAASLERAGDAVAARERLQAAERGNDLVLDRLLGLAPLS